MHAPNVLSGSQERGFKNMKNEDNAVKKTLESLTSSDTVWQEMNKLILKLFFFFGVGRRICNKDV